MFKKIIKLTLVLVIMVGLEQIAFGQPPAGPPPGGSVPTGNVPPCWAPECVPVDGGLGILLAAGAMLGFRTLKSKK